MERRSFLRRGLAVGGDALVGPSLARPAGAVSAYGTARDTYNRTTFTSVRASAFRLEAQLGGGVSGGILEWRITG